MASPPHHWSQQLKATIKLVAEITVPLISIIVAAYIGIRRCCTSRNRVDPRDPNVVREVEMAREAIQVIDEVVELAREAILVIDEVAEEVYEAPGEAGEAEN
ncbi:uncharacterized protein LOC126709212 [Quercus robur]|uniref:uncharacterized protein LOC126709212 n=1 Tax=Quercus robur TaxID=38942 RepID=UPI002162DA5C|nr:uncharacterized protein LOC126709212 [Quercus robur]